MVEEDPINNLKNWRSSYSSSEMWLKIKMNMELL